MKSLDSLINKIEKKLEPVTKPLDLIADLTINPLIQNIKKYISGCDIVIDYNIYKDVSGNDLFNKSMTTYRFLGRITFDACLISAVYMAAEGNILGTVADSVFCLAFALNDHYLRSSGDKILSSKLIQGEVKVESLDDNRYYYSNRLPDMHNNNHGDNIYVNALFNAYNLEPSREEFIKTYPDEFEYAKQLRGYAKDSDLSVKLSKKSIKKLDKILKTESSSL